MSSLVWGATVKVNAALGGGISIVVGILTARYLPGHPVELWLFALVVMLLIWLVWVLLSALSAAVGHIERLQADQGGAIVDAAVKPFSPYENSKCVFIVRFTGAVSLPMGAPVTISTAEAKHEHPLGTGFVRPPQQDGRSVVTLDAVNKDAAQFIAALLDEHQHDKAIAKIRIGPGYDLQNLQPRSLALSVGTLSSLKFDELMKATSGVVTYSGKLDGDK